MGKILHITSPMPPSVNHYLKNRVYVKDGYVRSRMYETKEARQYKEEFAWLVISAVNSQHWDVPVSSTQHFYVDAYYYFDRVDKDASNYEKCLCDAITETQRIWKDDNVVLYRPQRILYDRKNPRIELYISPADYVGIFDSEDDYKTFVSSACSHCTHYGRCSTIKKAASGEVACGIIHDGADYTCSRYKAVAKNP